MRSAGRATQPASLNPVRRLLSNPRSVQARIGEKTQVAKGTLMVTFDPLGEEVDFVPGRYSWVELPSRGHGDERGLRRHIKIVSSPSDGPRHTPPGQGLQSTRWGARGRRRGRRRGGRMEAFRFILTMTPRAIFICRWHVVGGQADLSWTSGCLRRIRRQIACWCGFGGVARDASPSAI